METHSVSDSVDLIEKKLELCMNEEERKEQPEQFDLSDVPKCKRVEPDKKLEGYDNLLNQHWDSPDDWEDFNLRELFEEDGIDHWLFHKLLEEGKKNKLFGIFINTPKAAPKIIPSVRRKISPSEQTMEGRIAKVPTTLMKSSNQKTRIFTWYPRGSRKEGTTSSPSVTSNKAKEMRKHVKTVGMERDYFWA